MNESEMNVVVAEMAHCLDRMASLLKVFPIGIIASGIVLKAGENEVLNCDKIADRWRSIMNATADEMDRIQIRFGSRKQQIEDLLSTVRHINAAFNNPDFDKAVARVSQLADVLSKLDSFHQRGFIEALKKL